MSGAALYGQAEVEYGSVIHEPAKLRTELPVTRLAVTYFLLLPLMLFAAHGGFSFEHSTWNTDLWASGGKIAMPVSSNDALRDRVQTSVGLGICLLAMASSLRAITAVAQRMPLFVLQAALAISSTLWSQNAGMSLHSGISLLVTTYFAFYLTKYFSERQQLELFILVGGVMAIATLTMVLCWPGAGIDHQAHEGAWQGLYTQKNACASATLFLLTPALALSVRASLGQFLRIIYVTLCLGIIFMTRSRTGWAITASYLVFVAGLRLLGRFRAKDKLPLAVLSIAFVTGAAALLISLSAVLLASMGRSEELSGRIQIWQAILESISRQPWLGYGFDAFWSTLSGEATQVFAATGWVVTSAHSGYLNVALELGLVGFALVMLTLLQAWRHAAVALRPGRSPYFDWCLGIIFLTTIYNLDERTVMAPQSLPWIFFIVACVGLRSAAHRESFTISFNFDGEVRR
jgi:exopolysaccharide production protein ExoQ